MGSRGWSGVDIASKVGRVATMDWGGSGDPIDTYLDEIDTAVEPRMESRGSGS